MISKILFTIAAVVAIWKAFTLISKLTGNTGGVPRPGNTGGGREAARPEEPKAVEMIACPRCGAYIDPRERCKDCKP